MDWKRAIEDNRNALLRVVALLLVRAGLTQEGSGAATLPRDLYYALLRILRPAESAARRLIIAAARDIPIPPPPAPRTAPAKPKQPHAQIKPGSSKATRAPAFRLVDPRKDFTPRKRYAKHSPRVTVIGYDDSHLPLCARRPHPAKQIAPPPPRPDDPIDARRLHRRLQALKHALDNLPEQAQRLAKREARSRAAPPGPGRLPPMRPGWPPGYRKKPVHTVDELLRECHWLANAREANSASLKPG